MDEMNNRTQRNNDGFQTYTSPANTTCNTANHSSFVPQIESDHFIPLVSAMRENTATLMARINGVESETKRFCTELKNEMHVLTMEAEKRGVAQDLIYTERDVSASKEAGRGSGTGKRKHVGQETLPGLEILWEADKMSYVISNWICNRVDTDLTKFWDNSNISNRNSSLSVMLFGVPRSEGHRPYSTSLGKDMGVQAREIVSKLMWNARCSVKSRSQYSGAVPKWIFSLVPICRRSLIGNESTQRGPRPEIYNEQSASRRETPRSNSTAGTIRSQTNIVNDYADLSNKKLGWEKEKGYFRDAVMKGCQLCEKPQGRSKTKDRKVARTGQSDMPSQDAFNRNLASSKEKLTSGAKAVRAKTNKFLSVNRVKSRERFYDIVGFVLYKITQMNISEARDK